MVTRLPLDGLAITPWTNGRCFAVCSRGALECGVVEAGVRSLHWNGALYTAGGSLLASGSARSEQAAQTAVEFCAQAWADAGGVAWPELTTRDALEASREARAAARDLAALESYAEGCAAERRGNPEEP